MYGHVNVRACAFACAVLRTCRRVRMHSCPLTCVLTRLHRSATPLCTHAYTHLHAHPHMHTRTRTCTRRRQGKARTPTQCRMRGTSSLEAHAATKPTRCLMHAACGCAHTHARTCTRACKHTDTRTRACVYTHAHAHAHMWHVHVLRAQHACVSRRCIRATRARTDAHVCEFVHRGEMQRCGLSAPRAKRSTRYCAYDDMWQQHLS